MAGAFDSSLLIPNSRHQSNGFGCSRAESPWSAQWPHVAQSLFEGRTNTTWLPPPSHVPNGIKYAFESARRDQCSEYDGDVAASSSLSSISRETRWPGQITVARLDPDIDGFHHPTMPTVPSSAPHLIWTTQAMTPSGKARPATLNRRASQSPANGLNQYFVPPPTSSANSVLSSQIKVDRYTPGPRTTRQPRQKPIFLSLQASIPVNQPWPLARQTMLSPASAQESLRQASSKRKLGVSGLDGDDFEAPNLSNGHAEISQHENRGKSSIPVIKREASEEKPSLPIPILPIPLPSKRFKKNSKSRAVLIPVEQLPVFALPPLPTIDDADLVKQVFSHQSLFERVRGRFEEPIDNPAKHYEKLEHVGDSILGMIVTTWLHETRPRLTCGSATILKAHLVSNATLSHLSGLYNLPQRLNGDPNHLPMLRAQTDVRAALMEAYIAALYFSFPAHLRIIQALPVIDGWLREMYEPLYDFFYNYMKTEYHQHHTAIGAGPDGQVIVLSDEQMARIDHASLGMAGLVQMYANKQERELRFEEERYETNLGLLYKMTCLVDGIELGEATRSSKKTAKNVASWEAAKKLGLTTVQ